MFRYLLSAFALLAPPCAAQIVTSSVLIPDSPRDGKIKLVAFASRVTPTVARNTLVYGPCNDAAPYQYSVAAPCPAVVPIPPVVTPPVVVSPPAMGPELVAKNGTTFFRDARLAGSIGTSGMLVSFESAPIGWPTASDEDGTVSYLGLKVADWKYDVIARGAAVDIAGLSYLDGAKRTELRATSAGASDFVGRNDGLTWTGSAGCFDVGKVRTIANGAIVEAVMLTNARCGTLTDVRYLRALDPDQDASMENVFTIRARGTVEAAPKKAGPVITLSTDDPRGVAFGIPNLMLPKTITAKLDVLPKIGSVTKGDGDAILLFRAGTVAAGQSINFTSRLAIY